nr:hypothetical protein [Tanacetum cinerariifolium]
ELSYNQNYDGNYYSHNLPSFPCCDNCGESRETFQCQPIAQNIDFSGSDQIQTLQYPEIHLSFQETSDKVFQANHSIQNEESFNEIAVSNSNQEKKEPPQDYDICQLIREECSTEVSEEQKQTMEDIMLELVKIYQEKEFLCIHDDVDDLIENDDDVSVYDDDFEYVEYVEASLLDPEIVSVEEENVVQQEEEEDDFKDISQIQNIVLHEKLLTITRLISNIESLNDNSTPDRVFNSFESDNSLLDSFSLEFETFCDHTEETRSGNTTHANYTLPEYDSFCFEIKLDRERLINLVNIDIPDDLSNNTLLEEKEIHFLEELLIDDLILSHESSDSNFEDNPSITRPPPELPDAKTNAGEEIPVMMNDKDEDVDKKFSLLFAESEDTIFDHGISE